MRDFFLRLLTHEVQIALSSECMSNETNHFMKLDATINNWCQRHEHTHVCVHLCIHQAKGQGLITNQCLEQFRKTLKKTLGYNRSVSKFWVFLKQGVYIVGGDFARSLHDQSLFLKETTNDHQVMVILHSDHCICGCVMCHIDLVCCQNLRQGCPWAEPGVDVSPSCLFCPCNPPHCYWGSWADGIQGMMVTD